MEQIATAITGISVFDVERKKYFNFAAVFYKTKLLKFAENLPYESHPLQEQYKAFGHVHSVHAEINCLAKYKKKFSKGLVFFSLRIDKSLNLKNAKPCTGCQEALKAHGFPGAYYSTFEGTLEWCGL